jgi:hypothetical protein
MIWRARRPQFGAFDFGPLGQDHHVVWSAG